MTMIMNTHLSHQQFCVCGDDDGNDNAGKFDDNNTAAVDDNDNENTSVSSEVLCLW